MEPRRIPVARVVRMPTGAHAEGDKVVICPTLSYLSNKPVAMAEMTRDEALMLACALIEAARRTQTESKESQLMPYRNIEEIRLANEAAGGDFFAWENARYFRRTFETGVIDGEYFITGERRPQAPSDTTLPRRRFTICRAREDGVIEVVGEFQEHSSLGLAKKALKHDLGVTL